MLSLLAVLALVPPAGPLWSPAAPAPLARALQEDPKMPADTEVKATSSGLKYCVLTPGQGPSPREGAVVTVHYSGWLTDGTLFDSSVKRGEPFEFMLGKGQVIKGWDEGVALMSKGARYKLIIPPEMGYGEQGSPPAIPANATLVFEVELLDFPVLPVFAPARPEVQRKLDSGLVVEVLKEGDGAAVEPGQSFNLRYALWNPSGKLLDCSQMSKQRLKGKCGAAPLKFLDEAVPLMKVGTVMRCEVPPELAFGTRAMGPDLPANSVSVWELELITAFTPPPLPQFSLNDPAKTVTTASGLSYEVLREGTGASPKLGQNVTVHYAGWLEDGKLFDASYNRGDTSTFQLGRVVAGWNEGLQLMKEGAIYRFAIPAKLGYGERGSPPSIPPNANLIFQIELVKVGD